MLCLVFGKKKPYRGSYNDRRSLKEDVYVNKKASLLAAAARTAEVSGLKRDLERNEEELSIVKRQLEENKGTQYPVCMFHKGKVFDANRSVMNFNRDHDRICGP